MAVRGEESAWFDVPYIGSRAAFGVLPEEALSVRRLGERADAGRGVRRSRVSHAWQSLDPARIACWLELHIEQGPVLLAAGSAECATVTGIRGCRRFRSASCHGAYGHSGADPARPPCRRGRGDGRFAIGAGKLEWLAREAERGSGVHRRRAVHRPRHARPVQSRGRDPVRARFPQPFRYATMDAMADTARTLAVTDRGGSAGALRPRRDQRFRSRADGRLGCGRNVARRGRAVRNGERGRSRRGGVRGARRADRDDFRAQRERQPQPGRGDGLWRTSRRRPKCSAAWWRNWSRDAAGHRRDRVRDERTGPPLAIARSREPGSWHSTASRSTMRLASYFAPVADRMTLVRADVTDPAVDRVAPSTGHWTSATSSMGQP